MQSIDLLIKNEGLIIKLYTIYAEKFPTEKEFWLKIAAEKNTNIEMFQTLRTMMQDRLSFIQESKFNLKALELSVSYLEDTIRKVQNHTLINALSVARDIEDSLIEHNFLKVISDNSIQLKNTLIMKIEQDAQKCRKEIQELWIKYTSK